MSITIKGVPTRFLGNYATSALPTTGVDEGDVAYDSTTKSLKVYNGSAWANASAIPGASDGTARGTVLRQTAQVDSTANDTSGIVADFNSLLAKLRSAGVIAT